MKKIIILILEFIVISYIIFISYIKYFYPPIPLINEVGLTDNILYVKFSIAEYNYNNQVYCLLTKNDEIVDENSNWALSSNNKCSFEIDDNIYKMYIKNKSNKIIQVTEASNLGAVTDIQINKEKVYLALKDTYTPTLTLSTIGNVDKTVAWKSDDENIATVDSNGMITAISNGRTNITASVKDKSVSIEVISTNLIIKRPKTFNNKKKYLTCDNYSKEENDLLDEILKDRINTVGYKTRAATVEAARFLTLEFPYKIRYFSENGRLTYPSKIDGEGRYYHEGLYLHKSRFKSLARSSQGPKTWGCKMYSRPSHGTRRNGLDCSGFISWVMLNGGFDVGDLGAGVSSGVKDLTDIGKKTRFTSSLIKNNKVKVGDLLSSSGSSGGHIAIIVGEDDKNYYVAESLWYNPYIGVVIVPYSKTKIFNRYYWIMLMDDFYKNDGNLTKMWY